MREILFRGKRVDNGERVEGDLLRSRGKCYIHEPIDPFDYLGELSGFIKMYEVAPETVYEFTGLTDKNGKKIFEGDIVKFYDTIHKVVFETKNGTAYFGIKISDIETWGFGNYVEVYKLEVIGNINDNPELIKEDKQ